MAAVIIIDAKDLSSCGVLKDKSILVTFTRKLANRGVGSDGVWSLPIWVF